MDTKHGLEAVPSACGISPFYNKLWSATSLFEFVLYDRMFIWTHKTNNSVCTVVCQAAGGHFQLIYFASVSSAPWLAQLILCKYNPNSIVFWQNWVWCECSSRGRGQLESTYEDRPRSMGNLTHVSWETALALACGQLFASQSDVPGENVSVQEMIKCSEN